MGKEAQWTTLGASWAVVIVMLVIFFLLSLQEVQVYKIDLSLSDYKLKDVHLVQESVVTYKIWFETHTKGAFNIQINDCNDKLVKSFNNVGGPDYTFYIGKPIDDDCINVILSTDKGKVLDRKNDVGLET